MGDDWHGARLPDLLRPGLGILFVGINPGRASAVSGHHFAGPQNAFWRLLFDSGLTPRLLRPDEDVTLPDLGIGIANLVGRPSHGEDDLAPGEFARGGRRLRALVRRLRPRVLALLGKRVATAYLGRGSGLALAWGPLAGPGRPGPTRVLLLPNPSSRSRVPYETRLDAFRAVVAAAGERP